MRTIITAATLAGTLVAAAAPAASAAAHPTINCVDTTRWKELAAGGLDRWADRVPENARGIGEIGRAALRVDGAVPVLVVAADPDSERGRELMLLTHRLFDPLALVRWIEPGDRATARRFEIEVAEEAAVYLVWDTTSPPIRDEVTLRAAFDDAVERVRTR